MFRYLPLALLVIIGCADPGGVGVKTGQKAPEFLARDTDDNLVKLSDYEGKIVLLDFWATWCPPCVASIPHEKRMVDKFAGKPFVLLGISKDRDKADLTNFLTRDPLPWKNLYDGAEDLDQVWEVEAFPTFVLIDEKGIVRGRWEGARLDAIEKRVEELLKKVQPR